MFMLLGFIASAQTTVTNLNSSGAGSLYDAINLIAATGGTINFDSNLSGTINITSGFPNITSSVIINGNGRINTIIDGGGTSTRMFSVSGSGSLTISGMTLKNNGNPGSNAGSIFYLNNVNGGITANDILLSGNSRTISFISNKGTLLINNSTIENNTGNYLFRSDWGNTPDGCPLTQDFVNKTIFRNSTFNNNSGSYIIYTERYVEIDNCSITNNAASSFAFFRGVNSYKLTNSTILNSGGFKFSSWIASNFQGWGAKILCSDYDRKPD